MLSLSREAGRWSTSLLTRGAVMVVLGTAALSWPDVALVGAMLSTAALLALFGAYEVFIAIRTRRTTRGWMVPMADGAACVGFAVLTLVFPRIPLDATLWLVAIWLVLYAALTATLALALWPMPRTRRTLIGWTTLNLVLAVLAVAYPQTTIFTLLYAGAWYAIAFGALQIVSARWIRQIAVPYVAPTVQTGWRTTPLHGRV